MAQTFGPPWTTTKLLDWTVQYFEKKGIEAARYEAELLLSYALDLERIMLYAYFERPMTDDELGRFRALVKRRAAGEPIAYIQGSKGFYNIDLKTDKRALIPRSDTEALVDVALTVLPKDSTARVLDVGTGTGAVALALAFERSDIELAASDIDPDALSLARENASMLGLEDRVSFFEGDLLDAVDWTDFDLIVSNPPYIAESERDIMGADVLAFEPHTALFAGADGLDILRRLVPQAHSRLKTGGMFATEIGFRQGDIVSALLQEHGFQHVTVTQDLGKRDRVVHGLK